MKKRLLVLLGIFAFFVHPEFTASANAQTYWTVLKNGAKWAKRGGVGFRIPKTATYSSTRASTTYRTTSAPSSLYPNGRVTHTTIKGRWGATTRPWRRGYKLNYKPSKFKINQVVRNAVKKSAVKVPVKTVARTGKTPTTKAASQVQLPQQTGPPSPTKTAENKALLAGRKAKQIQENNRAGKLREEKELAALTRQYPDAKIHRERLLRTQNGKKAVDPLTNTGRRVDFVVEQDKKPVDVVETTSKTAMKDDQMAKERRIRQAGGTYIRDKESKELIDIERIKTRISRRE